MIAASPQPAPSSFSFGHGHARPRQQLPRSHSLRGILPHNSPLSALGDSQGFNAGAESIQKYSIGDSSDDDEIPQPMAFSAQTKAILEDKPSARGQTPPIDVHGLQSQHEYAREYDSRSQSRAATPSSRGKLRISRRSPPVELNPNQQSPPRVVHLGNSSGLRKAESTSSSSGKSLHRDRQASQEAVPHQELITPAPRPRKRPAMASRATSVNSIDHANHSESAAHTSAGSARYVSQQSGSSQESQVEQDNPDDPITSTHDRTRAGQDTVSSSMRGVKKVSGRLLSGAPMRRGLRRRNSEDDQSPIDGEPGVAADEIDDHGSEERHAGLRSDSRRPEPPVAVHDFAANQESYHHYVDDQVNRPPSRSSGQRTQATHAQDSDRPRQRSPSHLNSGQQKRSSAQELPMFKLPAVPPPLPSMYDQENEPPPTFKRNKPQNAGILSVKDKITILEDDKQSKMLADTPATNSPSRPPLAQVSQNTPHRAPPPPPKMNVLDTATANAGASTVKSKKKRVQFTINGKTYTPRGRIGKGGSSDVYRVMAENDKMFALKKVNLADCNQDTIRGYKGEIELLKKLENEERVVRLFDYEINDQKQCLSVLMEIGENDLNRILSYRLQPENATLDLSFTRYYWREMLCCVSAVHAHDIVHSDLKPANFLLVQGRLKLIDFGIANAIDIDNTVNVHRDTNVGTPNYMSPESLQDSNGGERGMPKLMKLGKPSDVWSLGCILYQMTYGKPPFAHIANTWNRVMAIINPKIEVSYPTSGVGGIYVPMALRSLLKRCLNRDPGKRPSIPEMLSDQDMFLNPDRERDEAVPVTEHILGQVIQSVLNRMRDPARGPPSDADMKLYPKAFIERIRENMEKHENHLNGQSSSSS